MKAHVFFVVSSVEGVTALKPTPQKREPVGAVLCTLASEFVGWKQQKLWNVGIGTGVG